MLQGPDAGVQKLEDSNPKLGHVSRDAGQPVTPPKRRRLRAALRWVIGICAFLLIVATAAVLFKNPILKAVTESRIRSETGLRADIGELNVSLGAGTVRIRDFKLLNSPDFAETPLLHIPELYLGLDTQEAAAGMLRFREVRFHLAEVNIVRSKNGTLNIDALQKRHRERKPSHRDKSKDDFEFGGIDRLYLSFGTIRYTDLQNPSLNDEHVIGVQNQLIENIKTEEELQAHVLRILIGSLLQEWMNPSDQRPKRRGLNTLLKALGPAE